MTLRDRIRKNTSVLIENKHALVGKFKEKSIWKWFLADFPAGESPNFKFKKLSIQVHSSDSILAMAFKQPLISSKYAN